MSKRSPFSSSFVRNAPLCITAVLASALGCSSNTDAGSGAAGASAAGSPSGVAGMTAMASGGVSGMASAGAPAVAGAPAGGSAGMSAGGSGATAGSGGSGGASPSGGASGGGATSCKSFKICDDFEGDAPGMGMSPWKVTQGGGYTVVVDTTQAHSGTKSVHISAPVATGSGVLKETASFPATDFWGRAWMRFKTASGGHQMFIAVLTQGDQFRLMNTLGSDKIQLNEQSGDKFFASATTIPKETWFCYEWHVAPTGASVYVDGKELTDAKPTGWNIMNAQSLQIGYQRFQAGTTAGEIWLDDIAMNTAQIGCQ